MWQPKDGMASPILIQKSGETSVKLRMVVCSHVVQALVKVRLRRIDTDLLPTS